LLEAIAFVLFWRAYYLAWISPPSTELIPKRGSFVPLSFAGMMGNMAIEKSPYEGTFDSLNGRAALGRVVDVDITNRRCRVKTIGLQSSKLVSGKGTGIGTDDHDIPDVQWITTASSDGGAEDTSIPQIGQIGVLLYINHEPYLVGFFRTLQPSPEDETSTTEDPLEALITQGDRVLTTIGGNSVILRSGGSIEIKSTDLCRTYWLPSRNLVNTVCSIWELTTDGGYMNWELDPTTNDEQLSFFIQDNLEPTNAILAQYGTADNGNIADVAMGELDESLDIPTPSFHYGMKPDGSIDLEIGQNWTANVDSETGDTTINIGDGNVTVSIEGSTGNITFNTKGNLTQTITGDVDQTVDGNVSQTVSGNMTQTISGNMTSTVDGNLEADVSGTATVKAEGEATVSGNMITLDGTAAGGGGATGQVLVFPEALSDFTGAPVAPPSDTLKGSL
jgi:Gp5-like OB domain-containing protein